MPRSLGAHTPWQAPAHWQRIEFISDLHLCESMPHTAAAFLRFVQHTQADALCILGDLFEAWVGDDACELTFERTCVNTLAQCRAAVFVMVGNRDFLLGPAFARASGATLLPDPTSLHAFGKRTLLTHGDAWCLADTEYQTFRAEVRSAAWQQAFLSRPLEQRLALARQMRAASAARKTGEVEGWADVDGPTALAAMQAAQATELVHGHTHQPQTQSIGPDATRHVLSDWDLDGTTPRAEVLRLDAQGFQRISLIGH